ncbi:MAG TPA: hypothetical protein VMM79_14205 [Longimicrobiales bacterium]|nr:hypothetical protein [Longimicrobiales bacterium]
MRTNPILFVPLTVLAITTCGEREAAVDGPLADGIEASDLRERVTRFERADIDFDASVLEPWERAVIVKLVEASDLMHEIFALQVWPENADWQARLAAWDGPAADAARDYFDIMVGPWDRLVHGEPFLDAGPRPPGAGYYPSDLTQDEFDAWLDEHPDDHEAFTGYFTVIRRAGTTGNLESIPYSEFYGEQLGRAAMLLNEAADLSENASLADYLRKRADAFSTNDYYESDIAWMDITDSRIEPTIGPYEVYEDQLFGYKAAFESFITVADAEASAELEQLKNWLPALEQQLPIDDTWKNLDRSFESPIRVVDEVYTGGDTRAGVQTTAFNLPNDPRVHELKGSKKVMLRNVSRAKFDRILSPIASRVLGPDLAGDVAFQPWFTNVVMHELAHGLGPTTVTLPSGERASVNQALRENYSAIEEAKADVTGLHCLTVLAAEGVYDETFVRQAFIGHIADLFRAVRFGTGEAHGKANLVQFNWLIEKGAITYDIESRTISADLAAVIAANRELAGVILTLQARGDYDAAASLLSTHGEIRPELQALLAKLEDVPVDIRPNYTVLQKMADW